MKEPSRQAGRLQNIQVLRGVAGILVLLSHLGSLGSVFPFLPVFNGHHGILGVDLFFVISGFIMAYTTRNSWGEVGKFAVNRALRVYPLWWLCLMVEAPETFRYLIGHWDVYGSYYLKAFFLIPASTPRGDLYPPLVVGWTLIYEMFFYAVFACLMLTQQQWLTIKLAVILAAAYGLGLALPESDASKFLRNPIYLEFVLGVAIAETLYAGLLRRWLVALLLIASPLAWQFLSLGEAFRPIYYGIPALAIVALALYLEGSERSWLRPFERLGDISYSLYLTHGIVLMSVAPYLEPVAKALPSWISIAALFSISIGVAWLVYSGFEKPLDRSVRWLRKKKWTSTRSAY
jgi:exopolysaccharide production protein ExoZ